MECGLVGKLFLFLGEKPHTAGGPEHCILGLIAELLS